MTEPLADWRQEFRSADSLPPTATRREKAARGRMLERILFSMFEEAGLSPRLSYRPRGEEVDGSIWFGGRTILIEAKWTGEPQPASSLYQFKGKVDGRLAGTLGLFVSVGGFSVDSVDALVAGKELKLILADGDDLREVVEGNLSILEALERKLRAAGDAGTPFFPLSAPTSPRAATGRHLVVLEGHSDARYLESILRVHGRQGQVTFVPASGSMNIAPITRLMLEVAESVNAVTVVVDGDLEGSYLERLLDELGKIGSENGVGEIPVEVIVVRPSMEVALGLAAPDVERPALVELRRISDESLDELIAEADLVGRANTDHSLAQLLRAIGLEGLESSGQWSRPERRPPGLAGTAPDVVDTSGLG